MMHETSVSIDDKQTNGSSRSIYLSIWPYILWKYIKNLQ